MANAAAPASNALAPSPPVRGADGSSDGRSRRSVRQAEAAGAACGVDPAHDPPTTDSASSSLSVMRTSTP